MKNTMSKARSGATASPSKQPEKRIALPVEVTPKQLKRLRIVAALLGVGPGELLLGNTLGNLDKCSGPWSEFEEIFHQEVIFYARQGHVHDPDGEPVEDSAPYWRRRTGHKEVRHA